MSKSKAQGTAWEVALVKMLNEQTDGYAERIAEGGSKDLGDVRYEDVLGDEWIIECKATETLSVTMALHKAKKKSGVPNTILAWKRLTPKAGKQRRTPMGEPEVYIVDRDTMLGLLGAHPDD